MSQFRKKPRVVDAVQFDGHTPIPGVIISPVVEPTSDNPSGVYGQIQTLEGTMTCIVGDWIITGVKGERYPCKPDIFEATYEPASSRPAVVSPKHRSPGYVVGDYEESAEPAAVSPQPEEQTDVSFAVRCVELSQKITEMQNRLALALKWWGFYDWDSMIAKVERLAAQPEGWQPIAEFLREFVEQTDGAELPGKKSYVACPDDLRNRAIDLIKALLPAPAGDPGGPPQEPTP